MGDHDYMFSHSGGYRRTDTFHLAWIVELATNNFCDKYLHFKNDPGLRTYAQMNQAARSGCRNFAEGSERIRTSVSSGVDLLNVSRGSIKELGEDYLKWLLRQRELPWPDDSSRAQEVRSFDPEPPPSDGPYTDYRFGVHVMQQYDRLIHLLEHEDPNERARTLLILCTRVGKMMDSFHDYLMGEFKEHGGFKEHMSDIRREARSQQLQGGQEAPPCPKCGGAMQARHRRHDNAPFWGCTLYPQCDGKAPFRQQH